MTHFIIIFPFLCALLWQVRYVQVLSSGGKFNVDNNETMTKPTKKSVLVLALYDSLLFGEKINKGKYCSSHHLATRTFCRYLVDVRDVLSIRHPDLVLVYDRPAGVHYIIKKDKPIIK
jgi:hypothetical protein